MILRDFLRALAQVDDPRFLRVLLLGMAGAVALLGFCYGLVLWLIDLATADGLHLPGVGRVTWLGDLLHWASLLFMLALSVVLMVPVASAITAFFLDDVAEAVEARHYPHLPPGRRQGLVEGIVETLSYFALLLAVNALLLIPAILMPPAAPFLFYGVNGWLLGREYFTLIARRRMPPDQARQLRRKHWLRLWIAGVLMALPLTLPLINLAVPVLATATFCHLYHRLTRPNLRLPRVDTPGRRQR